MTILLIGAKLIIVPISFKELYMKRIVIFAIMTMLVGCSDFESSQSPVESEKKTIENEGTVESKLNYGIPVFADVNSLEEGMEWKYISWLKPAINKVGGEEIIFEMEDTLTISLEKIEGTTLHFKEISYDKNECFFPEGTGIAILENENYFSLSIDSDSLIFDGESKLFEFLDNGKKELPKAPFKHIESLNFKDDFHKVAYSIDNGYASVSEVTIIGGKYSNVLVNCDARLTYVDGPGHCFVFSDKGLLAVANFAYDIWTSTDNIAENMDGRLVSSGYVLIQ